jgi:serine/threonine protein kinase
MGPYRLLECLGESELGAVFQARHLDKKRTVVLKIIRGDLLADPAVLERNFQVNVMALLHLVRRAIRKSYDNETRQDVSRVWGAGDLQNAVRDGTRFP